MGECSLRTSLATLPSPDDEEYELNIIDMLETAVEEDGLKDVTTELSALARPADFHAFYALCTLYRRNLDSTEFTKLISEAVRDSAYAAEPMFLHLEAMAASARARSAAGKEGEARRKELRKACQKARECVERLESGGLNVSAGVWHHVAETVADAAEEPTLGFSEHELDAALTAVDTAIDQREAVRPQRLYGKFMCTKGRLLAHDMRFNEAKAYLYQAIDHEDPTLHEYPVRLLEYHRWLGVIDARAAAHAGHTRLAGIEERVTSFEGQNLAFLGFFAAIVAFTVGSLQLTAGAESFHDAALLIGIMAASLVLVFAAFAALFIVFRHQWRAWVLVIAAALAALVVMGLLVALS